ncbi:MAG: hypothetical protein HXX16_08535 [Bacteroidales bacterium]|nr:hypothetical protein [Bacteroidales bacterium]
MIKKWLRNSRMGFLSGQSGIMRRMLREEGGWQSHLIKTSEYIQQAVKDQQPKSIRILGSGWLLDVPMQFLIERCERIILTDIVHPNQIINKYSGYNNVEFETLDITGGIVDLIYNQKKKDFEGNEFIQKISAIKPLIFSEDIIVSVNLLSQLSVILTDYLTKKIKLTDIQSMAIMEEIQKKHIEILPAKKSVLIFDYEEEYHDEDGKLIGSKPTVYTTIPRGDGKREWNWRFDTKMMYKEDCKTILSVIAIRL